MNITIRQRENKKWQGIVSYKDSHGKWVQKSQGGFCKRKDANLWAKEMSFELQKLEKKGILENSFTLGQVYFIFMEKNKNSFSLNTKKGYERMYNFFESFMHEDILNINPLKLSVYIEEQRELNNKKYDKYLVRLNTIFKFAINKLKVAYKNPCDVIPHAKNIDKEIIKFIDVNLYKKILQSIKNEKINLFVRVLYETGMRASEVFGLATQNINNYKIKVVQQMDTREKVIKKELKTKNSYREVPISRELYFDLKKSSINVDGLIFYNISYSGVARALKPFKTTPHCFRHTRATNLVSSGIDLTIVAHVIGDKIETIMSTYVEKNTNNLDDKFEQIRQII